MKSFSIPAFVSRSTLLLTAAALPSPVFADLTWNSAATITNNWSTAAGNANWNPVGVVWTQNENAIFDATSGAAETVDVTTVNTFNNITFGVTGFVISSAGAGSLALANDQASTITVTNAADTGTINELIANNAAGLSTLTKAGLGTLVLGGANTYTGQTTIAGGTLKAGNAAALGAGGAGAETIVQSGATLDVNGQALTNTEIVRIAGTGVGSNGAVVNTGAAQQNAFNRIELTADGSIGGTARFDVRGGTTPTLDLAGFTLTKVGANQVSIVGSSITNGNIQINAGTLGIETTSLLQGSGTVNVNAGGTLGLWGNTAANVTRPITLNNGAIGNLGSTGTINSPITLNGGGTLSVTGAFSQTYGGNIDGTGPLNVIGTGATQLNGTGSYSGGTTITDARLQIGTNIAGVADGTITVNGDGTVNDGQFFMSGAAILPATKSFIISGRGGNAADGVQRGAIRVENGAAINGTITLAANAAVGSNTAIGTLNGVISGAFELSKVDPQTIVLTADNTYSGGTRVQAGTLQLDYNGVDSGKLADGGILTMAGGTLSLAGTGSTTHTELVASTTLAAGSTSTISRTSGTSNRIALGAITRESGASLNIAADGIATTTNVPVGGNLGPWLTVGGTSLATVNGSNEIVAVTYTDVPTGTGILTDGLGDVRLTGAAGAVALGGSSGEVIDVGSLSRSAAGLVTINTTGKTLRLGQSGGIFSATGSGGITIGTASNAGTLTAGGADNTAGTLDFNLVAGNVTVNSTITNNGTGAVGIIKAGTPELTLTGNNSYSGGTTLAGGVLRVGTSDNAIGTGTLTFTKNSTFATANGLGARNIANSIVIDSGITGSIDSGYANLTLSGVISGAGNLSTTSTGTTVLTGANTYAGTTTATTGAVLQVGNGGTSGSLGTGSVTVTGTLAFNRSNAHNLNNSFNTSQGTLRQDGSGMLNIQGGAALLPTNVLINGPVTLTGGGFGANRMNAAGVVTIGGAGSLTIPSGSAHALGGDNATMTESVVINGGTLTVNQEQYFKTLTLNGAKVGGTNEIRVSASPAFSVGGTAASTVSARVNNFNAVTWTVADATSSSAADLTISGQITGGNLTKAGPGTMVISNANSSYTGTTTVSGGTLLVNGGKTGTGNVNVSSGGTLGGTGTIAGALTVSAAGFIAPGTSTGDLTVGATTLSGTYACEINDTAEDTLVVNGNLNLTGASLNVIIAGPVSQPSYVIATYTGALTGTFGAVTGLPATYVVDYSTAGQIKLVGSGVGGYPAWLAGYPTLSDTNPESDPEHDGVANILEYSLGGNPTLVDSSVLPKVQVTATNFVFSFKRSDASEVDTMLMFEWGTSFSSWTPAMIPAETSGNVTVVENGSAADDVTVTIPRAGNPKIFARLRAMAN